MSQVVDPTGEPLEAIPVDEGPGRAAVVAGSWVGLGLLAVFVLWFAWTQVINPSGGSEVEQFVAGDSGHLYESLRDQFRVEYPTEPRRREQPGPLGPIVIVDSRPGADYLFAVIREPEPETGLENYRPTLNNAAVALAGQVKGSELVSQSPPIPIPINAVAVKDVVFRKGDQYYRNRLILATDRMYTLQVMVEGDDEDPFTAMAKTFKVLGPR